LASSATSLALAAAATLAGLLMTLAALQGESGQQGRLETLVYLPLIVPQVVFLPGIATALLTLPVPPLLAVAAGHLVFVLPYVFLALAGPFRAWDGRMAAVATTLGAGPWRILLKLRLPMLAGPLAAAGAIGFAVSIGQYLPTLLLGGGRVATLTTEAVALASGANRRILGAYGLLQAFWPALVFALARRIKAA
jgi:putative thiamine transport system permease protein